MVKIFVSYSSQDRKLIEDVEGYLKPTYNIWYDKKSLIGGQEWWQEILSQVHECDLFLFFASEKSQSSEWCQKEVVEAIEHKKTIIPVRIEDISLLPELQHLHAISMFKGLDSQAKRAIYRAIANVVGSPLIAISDEQKQSDMTLLRLFEPCISDSVFRNLADGIIKSKVQRKLYQTVTMKYDEVVDNYVKRFYNKEIIFAFEDYTFKNLAFGTNFGVLCSLGKPDKDYCDLTPRRNADREKWKKYYKATITTFHDLDEQRHKLISSIQVHYPKFIVST